MLIEQGEAVDTNVSKIARMKTRAGLVSIEEYAPVAKEFNEVFGGEHPTMSWHWFLPLPVRFPEWAKDNILGYEWDVTFPPVPYEDPGDTDADSVPTIDSKRTTDSKLSLERPGDAGPPLSVDVETGGKDPLKKRNIGSFT